MSEGFPTPNDSDNQPTDQYGTANPLPEITAPHSPEDLTPFTFPEGMSPHAEQLLNPDGTRIPRTTTNRGATFRDITPKE